MKTEQMTVKELKEFMNTHGFNERTLGEFLGVTVQGVRLWLSGQRFISKTNTKLIRLLNKYPQLMNVFQEL